MTKPVGYLVNTAEGMQGEPGITYDYIIAGNGLFLQAKNAHLAATVCIAPQMVRGLAPLETTVQLLHSKIPLRFLDLVLSVFCAKPDVEQYIAITWQGNSYSLNIPTQTQTAASVTYDVLADTVLGIHSHGNMEAFFSSVDDHDEQGFSIYAVVGDLRGLCPTAELRLGVFGYFMHLDNSEVFG